MRRKNNSCRCAAFSAEHLLTSTSFLESQSNEQKRNKIIIKIDTDAVVLTRTTVQDSVFSFKGSFKSFSQVFHRLSEVSSLKIWLLTSCWPYFTIFTCQCFNFCVNFLISYLIKLVIVIFISSFSSVSTQLLPILANLHGPIFQLTFGEILNWTLACKCCCTTDKLEQLERLNLCL